MHERSPGEQIRYFKELTLNRLKEIKETALESQDTEATLIDIRASIQTSIDYSVSEEAKELFLSLQTQLNELRVSLEDNPWPQIVEFLESYETAVRSL